LSGSARLLILDEPTAALSHHEAEVLFGFIRKLQAQAVAIIYITHRLDEVSEIADRVQVLRDGVTSLVAEVAATDRPAMIEAMIMSSARRRQRVGSACSRRSPGGTRHPAGPSRM
jgi:ribose transport system ATP-binding protein